MTWNKSWMIIDHSFQTLTPGLFISVSNLQHTQRIATTRPNLYGSSDLPMTSSESKFWICSETQKCLTNLTNRAEWISKIRSENLLWEGLSRKTRRIRVSWRQKEPASWELKISSIWSAWFWKRVRVGMDLESRSRGRSRSSAHKSSQRSSFLKENPCNHVRSSEPTLSSKRRTKSMSILRWCNMRSWITKMSSKLCKISAKSNWNNLYAVISIEYMIVRI